MDNPLDIALNKLVEKVKCMSKKPSLDTDIRTILDQCVENVEQQSVYLENGIFNFNFAGVAIVLEQVSLIYGKKVDLLWDNLLNYQKRLLKFNTEAAKTQAEEKVIEERAEKYKRRRKKPPEKEPIILPQKYIPLDMEKIIAEISIDYDEEEELSLNYATWELFSQFPVDIEQDPIDRYDLPPFIASKYPITVDDEYICDNTDLLSNYFSFQASDIIRQVKRNFLCERHVDTIGHDIQDQLIQQYIVENNIKFWGLTEKEMDDLEEYVYRKLVEKMPLQQRCRRLCPRRSSIMLTRLSDDVVQQYLKKDRRSIEEMSTSGKSAVSHDSGVSELDANDSGTSQNLEVGEGSSLARPEKDARYQENIKNSSDLEVGESSSLRNEEDIGIGASVEVRINEKGVAGSVANLVPNLDFPQRGDIDEGHEDDFVGNSENGCYSVQDVSTGEGIDKDMDKKGTRSKQATKEGRLILDKTIEMERKTKQARKNLKRHKSVDEIDENSQQKKRPRRSITTKLKKIITKPLKDFEIFFYENYRTQVGEGKLVITNYLRAMYKEQSKALILQNVRVTSLKRFETFFYKNYVPEEDEGDLIEPIFYTDVMEEEDCYLEPTINPIVDLEDMNNETNLNDSGIVEDISFDSTPVPSTSREISQAEPSTSSEEDPPIRYASFFSCAHSNTSRPVVHHVVTEVSREHQIANERFLDWRLEIHEKLAKTDKHDFNIHEYESKVLDKLPDNGSVKFENVMGANKASEVARLFAASLQLVNNSNIEFVNREPGKLGNDDLEIRLLSRDRHHEQLGSYLPSSEHKIEAMKRISAMKDSKSKRSQEFASTSSIPHKKRKLFH